MNIDTEEMREAYRKGAFFDSDIPFLLTEVDNLRGEISELSSRMTEQNDEIGTLRIELEKIEVRAGSPDQDPKKTLKRIQEIAREAREGTEEKTDAAK